MYKKTIEISKKYDIKILQREIKALDKKLDLKIGFLGEFSSGKSTLINALLNQKILPSMDKPTSKSIIEIMAKDNLKTLEFYELKENKKEQISAIHFSKIALEKSNSNAMIHVPSNDFFQDGYMMIDTPGISSLEESDSDITYGYLPFLDGAVICNHIQKGSLTQSTIHFLLKNEIRPIINNILFVITNAYSKAPTSQLKIKEEIITQLSTLNQKYTLGLKDIDSKVIMLSALEAMEGKNGFSLDEIKESFHKNFMSKKNLLQKQRKAKAIEKISKDLLETLVFKKENSQLDLSDLRTKESKINEQIVALEEKKSITVKSLEAVDTKIQEYISTVFIKYLPQLKVLKDQESTTKLINEFQEVIHKDISKIISSHFQELSSTNENHIEFKELEIMIQDLLKQIDMGKDIGMVILIELLTLGTAGVGGIFGFFLRSTSKMIINQRGESNLKDTANYINQVNPMEMIGDMIGSKFIESQILAKLEELSKGISLNIKVELENQLEELVFSTLKEKLLNNQKMLNQLYKEKSEKLDAFTQFNQQLDNDILELQLMKRA
jgi:ribosome biogenesis GTPase A